MRFSRITIISTRARPDEHNINELLQWFGGSLGLFNPRDRDKSCYRVFLALVESLRKGAEGLTSDELAVVTNLSRGTVVHHLNRLMESGIVVVERNHYSLRVETMEELVGEIRKQLNRTFDGLTDIARYIDNHLDL